MTKDPGLMNMTGSFQLRYIWTVYILKTCFSFAAINSVAYDIKVYTFWRLPSCHQKVFNENFCSEDNSFSRK